MYIASPMHPALQSNYEAENKTTETCKKKAKTSKKNSELFLYHSRGVSLGILTNSYQAILNIQLENHENIIETRKA